MAKKLLTLILSICLIFLLLGLLPVHGEEKIYGSVIRLHVLANSDSEADQALKLKVRDRILTECSELFVQASSKEQAEKIISSAIADINAIAEDEILKEGYNYPVTVTLTEEVYPTRSYESIAFPSGEYLSLRIMIGDAEGENWWCVLFPPLCLEAAKANSAEDAFISVGLNTEEYKIITETNNPKYKVRFKLLEAIQGIGN